MGDKWTRLWIRVRILALTGWLARQSAAKSLIFFDFVV
jgi:hypothetical protein